MLCFEINCSTSLWSKPYKIMYTFVSGLHWRYNAIMRYYASDPYEYNVIGGFFELKRLLEISFSAKVNANIQQFKIWLYGHKNLINKVIGSPVLIANTSDLAFLNADPIIGVPFVII